MDFENANPEVVSVSKVKRIDPHPYDDDYAETIDGEEVFDLIRDIGDPEHPLTLEQLKVVCKEQIYVKNKWVSHFIQSLIWLYAVWFESSSPPQSHTVQCPLLLACQ